MMAVWISKYVQLQASAKYPKGIAEMTFFVRPVMRSNARSAEVGQKLLTWPDLG